MEAIDNLRKLLNKNRTLSWFFFISYIAIFIGCAGFPLLPQYTGFSNVIIQILNAVYIIPFMFVALLGTGKKRLVYGISLLSLLLGMLCRFLIEFGEVSNSMNFTTVNIVSFLALLPLLYTLTYYVYGKKVQ